MNKFILNSKSFIALFLILLFSGCSSDNSSEIDNQEDPPTNLLLGTWEVKSFTFICQSGISDEVFREGCISESFYSYQLGADTTNVFKGIYHSQFYGENGDGNCIVLHETNGEWFLDGDLLTTVRDGVGLTREIFDLTENSYREMEELDFYTGTPCSESDPGIRYTNYIKIE